MSELPRELPSVAQFFKTIHRSGLLTEPYLRSWLLTLPSQFHADTGYVSDALVRSGKLSRFQATMLLRGMARGLLMGPYQILSQVGKGGMGTVYLARDGRTQGLVALKILSPKRAREEERMIVRFQREMELSRKVNHPHLCRTLESGVLNHVFYLAMEFIPGKSLHRVVTEDGVLPVPRLARLMAEVASGLGHAHAQGLIHRDLKPSNIMITPHDQAKLLDLGLALIEGEVVVDATVVGGDGYIVGTMDFIAPEQTYDATAVDGRADLYSLGCTMYFSLTGQVPFPGGTSKEKVYKQRKAEPTPLAALRPELPRGFVTLVGRLMAKNPDDRPSTAAEVGELLLRWAGLREVMPSVYDLEMDVNVAVAVLRDREPSGEIAWGAIVEATPVLEPAGDEDLPALEEIPTHVDDPESATPRWLGIVMAALLVGLLGFLVALLSIIMRRR